MNVETFFEKFEMFASAPDAITAMRSLVLRLAMQGKLCDSHPSDGETLALLRRVNAEREQLGLESIGTTMQGTSEPEENTAANEIPAQWIWVRFGDIARHNAGKTLDKGRNRGKLREYITTSNLYWGFFQLDALRQMPISDDELERCTATKGDLLIVEGGEAGRAAVWDQDREIAFQNHIHRARFFAGIDPQFVQRYFEKLKASGEIEKYRKGVGISNMSGKSLASIPIPLPPLDEQKRIVAKVDELMALCDRLEAQQQQREQAHAALSRATLARFVEEPSPATLELVIRQNFAVDPKSMRPAIVRIAMQGTLTRQHASETVANTDLRRAREEFALAGECDPETPVRDEDRPFGTPRSWPWVRLGDIARIKHGFAFPSAGFTSRITPFVLTTPGSFYERGGFRDRGAATKYYNGAVDPAFVLKAGDLIIPMTEQAAGLLGSPAFVPADGKTYIHNQRIGKVELATAVLMPEFVYWFFNTDFFRSELARTSTGMKVRHTSPKRVLSVPIPIPPLAEQRRIVAKLNDLMALLDRLAADLAAARGTGEALMHAVVHELIA